MADGSAIEWTDATWNPIRARRVVDGVTRIGWHCEHVSEGCRNCYAEGFNRRLGTKLDYKPGNLRSPQRPQGEVEVFLDETARSGLLAPLRWRAPRKIFVGSMTDVFADFVTDEWLDRMFAVMALCPQHVFQLLTKRPERMRDYLGTCPPRMRVHAWAKTEISLGIASTAADSFRNAGTILSAAWPLSNVWLGTSIEDRAALLDRAGHLRKTPTAVRFFSCEPLLGDLGQVVLDDIDWVICGGESGPGARPMHPDWARSLRDQCAAAEVPFFFKQWGEWAPGENISGAVERTERIATWWNDEWMFDRITPRQAAELHCDDEPDLYRCGKRNAGRWLDAMLHEGMPAEAPRA